MNPDKTKYISFETAQAKYKFNHHFKWGLNIIRSRMFHIVGIPY